MSAEEKVEKKSESDLMETDSGNNLNESKIEIKEITEKKDTPVSSESAEKDANLSNKEVAVELNNDEKTSIENIPISPSEVMNGLEESMESKYNVEKPETSQESVCSETEIAELDLLNKTFDSSAVSNASGDDLNENIEEIDISDVSSSLAENDNICDTSNKLKLASKRPKRKQPAIMSAYKKRRKISKKQEDDSEMTTKVMKLDNGTDGLHNSEAEGSTYDERSEGSHHTLEHSSSEENLFEGESGGTVVKVPRRRSSLSCEPSDKYCWICHKESGIMYKCIACPRVFHVKCHVQVCNIDPRDDPDNFQCPECVAALKADNVNTRSPTLATVNLDQLCVSLKHVINLLKAQKDSHYFWSPVDTKEFPHYRDYVIHPMDLQILEKNVTNKMYGCTEAFLADVKWIVHNSIVFNSKAAKITNVAKNLLKTCKRELTEIETCAECYYNSIVKIDTWFIEVCKKPHLLVWARLKGYPPWPAKALKCKDNMVDCRFFGAHDKAWVPLKDCFLYSKLPPQPSKLKKGSHLELGIKELEKHINKLKEKFEIFRYPPARTSYLPSIESEQMKLMLPNYDDKFIGKVTAKYVPSKDNSAVKSLFSDKESCAMKDESDTNDSEKQLDDMDNSSSCTDDLDKPLEISAANKTLGGNDSFFYSSESESETAASSECPEDEKKDSAKSPVVGSKPGSPVRTVEKSSSQSPSTSGSGSLVPMQVKNEKMKSVDVDKVNKITVVEKSDSVTPAAVPKLIRVLPTEAVNAKVSSSSEINVVRPTNNKSPSKSSVPADSTSKLKPLIVPADCIKKPVVEQVNSFSSQDESTMLDMSSIKEEPIEVPEDPIGDDVVVEKHVPKVIVPPASQSALTTKKSKLTLEDALVSTAKKSKVDGPCRTVNITENVTLSVVDQIQKTNQQQQANQQQQQQGLRVVDYRNLLPKKAALKTSLTKSVTTEISNNAAKMKPSVPVSRATSSPTVQAQINKAVKILPRKSSTTVTYTNGLGGNNASSSVNKPSKLANILPAMKTKDSVSVNTTFDELLLSEFQTHFKGFFENMLEKLTGSGDLRAKVVSLQKELETAKRTHEIMIDEVKRDYETQIAELRATSIAKNQYDVAAERLKLEQEKERAVKEAKSKQWCSNCQKGANYYCCWNTAYCDFECQKEHWIQHMHVCKNDVKKKAAESSENEPPRIMMQNDASNGYLLNGYDKPATTYTYQNATSGGTCRSFNRGQTKNSARSIARTVLSKVSSTSITCTPSSSSSSSVGSSSPSSLTENISYQSVSSSSMAANRLQTFTRQIASFHK